MFIIASFTTGKYLWKIGRERALIFGMLLIVSLHFIIKVVGIFGLGFLIFLESKTMFVVFSFIAKMILGIGSGMNSTASKLRL